MFCVPLCATPIMTSAGQTFSCDLVRFTGSSAGPVSQIFPVFMLHCRVGIGDNVYDVTYSRCLLDGLKSPKASLHSSLPSEGYVIWAVQK